MSKLAELLQELSPNEVKQMRLGEVLSIKSGSDYKHLGEGSIPVYGSGGIMVFVDKAAYDKPSVLIPRKGSLHNLFYVEEPFWTVDTIFYTEIKTEVVDPKYVFYFLQSQHLERLNMAGGVPSLNKSTLDEIEIFVPPLEIQQEIVRVLDCFTELNLALEEEYNLRQKQYVYYRDDVLAFSGDVKFEKLKELIQELCSNGVEFKRLSEIANIRRGGSLQKKDFTETGVPCIHYGQIHTKYGLAADSTFSFISEDTAQKQKFAEPNDIIMAVTSENKEDVCKSVAWLGSVPVAVSSHTAIIHHNQNPRYLSYFFQSVYFQEQKNCLAHGTKVMEINPSALLDVIVPIPPLEVQQEIVRILDCFTELNELLKKEMFLLKKQYEYYRDKLLTFNSSAG